jgi:hypothetical protein
MSGRYPRTRRALIGAHPGAREGLTNTITREFERPKVINRRSGDVATAAGVSADESGSPEIRVLTTPGTGATVRSWYGASP